MPEATDWALCDLILGRAGCLFELLFKHFLSIVIMACLLAWSPPGSATTIVFYIARDHIIAGSDGKISNVAPRTSEIGPKIFTRGNVLVGTSGILNDSKSAYDAWYYSYIALAQTNSLLEAVRLAEASCSNSLYQIWTRPEGYPEQEMKKTRGRNMLLQLGFASLRDGIPEMHSRDFVAATNSSGQFEIQVMREDISSDKVRRAIEDPQFSRIVYPIGWHMDIGELSTNQWFWKTNGDVEGVVKLIRTEIDKAPEDVGFPIYLVRLSTNGIQKDPAIWK